MSGKNGSFRIGDLVTRGDKRGQVIGGAKGSWTVAFYDDKGKLGSPEAGIADAHLKAAGYQARMSNSGVGPLVEVAINAVVYAVIQKFRKSSQTFGPRFMSFALADAIYELVAKHFVEGWVPFLRPDALLRADDNGFFTSGDFKDAAKAIPIVIIQELASMVLPRQPKMFTHILKNAIDAYAAVAVGNIAGRFASGQMATTEGASPLYRW